MGAAAQVQVQRFERSNFPPQAQTGKASVEGTVLDAVTREPVKKASVMLNGRVGLNPHFSHTHCVGSVEPWARAVFDPL
jgi:hypothetical protein